IVAERSDGVSAPLGAESTGVVHPPTEAGDDCPPGEIPAVVVDDEETSRVRSDVDGGDPHRLRPGRPGGVADALDHTGDDTVERLDPGGDQLPHRVGVAGGEV